MHFKLQPGIENGNVVCLLSRLELVFNGLGIFVIISLNGTGYDFAFSTCGSVHARGIRKDSTGFRKIKQENQSSPARVSGPLMRKFHLKSSSTGKREL